MDNCIIEWQDTITTVWALRGRCKVEYSIGVWLVLDWSLAPSAFATSYPLLIRNISKAHSSGLSASIAFPRKPSLTPQPIRLLITSRHRHRSPSSSLPCPYDNLSSLSPHHSSDIYWCPPPHCDVPGSPLHHLGSVTTVSWVSRALKVG